MPFYLVQKFIEVAYLAVVGVGFARSWGPGPAGVEFIGEGMKLSRQFKGIVALREGRRLQIIFILCEPLPGGGLLQLNIPHYCYKIR